MRILQLCPKPPRPARDGGCLAMDALTRGLLADGHSVRLLVASTEKHPNEQESLDPLYVASTNYQAVEIDTALNIVDALSHLITGESYHIGRFHVPDFERELEVILRNEVFDVVLLESLFMTSYEPAIRRLSDARVILRAHNVEHRIWQGLVDESKMGLRKLYISTLTKQLAEYESIRINDFDALIPITDEDAEIFREIGATIPIHVTPFGMDYEDSNDTVNSETVDHVFHFGSMDWQPNIQGVKWLLEEVWPKVRNVNSEAKLILAGRKMPASFVTNAELGIEVIGEVESAQEFLDRRGIMTIPIHSGSGMRVKAVEGMSAGRPAVSTEIGVSGLDLENGEHALIANSPTEFASHIIELLNNPELSNSIAQKGKAHIRNKFSNKNIVSKLVKFIHTL
ncbi:MAG TPA: glycosyltransferase [Flavobacteriales bacterium]|nr:glycosyltransferase [Flavobacteriales bacterium]HIB76350.1 glycosyltransferase [Flavobacteriales bacterium]HIN42085.1 glycosyltransferase [Flavobacteriales bacterium]HIO16775.1 glycosyltransferase [Flavobacteriales bacterium]HIO60005.1 glycosyltransferase [Flavobacteriales bacterium]